MNDNKRTRNIGKKRRKNTSLVGHQIQIQYRTRITDNFPYTYPF